MKRKTLFLPVFLMCLLFLSINVKLVFATTIFEDGFESGDLSAWTGDNGYVEVVSTYAYQGTYSAKITGPTWGQGYCYKEWSGTYDTVFVRHYRRFESMDDWTRDLVHVISTSPWQTIAKLQASNSKLRIYDQVHDTNYDYSYSFQTDTWYCLEIKVKLGSNGELRAWLNGTEVITATGIDFSSYSSINRVEVSQSAGGSELVSYVDCVVIADIYIGPEAELTEESVSANLTIDTITARNVILLRQIPEAIQFIGTVGASVISAIERGVSAIIEVFSRVGVTQFVERSVSAASTFIGYVVSSLVSYIERTVSATVVIFAELQSVYEAVKSAFVNLIVNAIVSRLVSLSRAIGLDIVINTIAKTGFQLYEITANAILYIITEIGKMGGIVATKGWVMGVMLAFGSIFLIAIVIFILMRKVIA